LLKTAIETSVEADYPKLDALYKEVRTHPEIAFQEVKTLARLAAEMRAPGFDVTEKVGQTGLAAIYKNGDGPNIGVYEPERVAAAWDGTGPQLPSNHSPLFAPVPKPTIETGIEACCAERLRSACPGQMRAGRRRRSHFEGKVLSPWQRAVAAITTSANHGWPAPRARSDKPPAMRAAVTSKARTRSA
jgi:hypothetical protein